ncbi:ribbon-helix-helix domain-containing protein, partial [Pyrobaculum sp.]|uniref:ribbon-helix-helix domain-containing protein n=1 Tax=Pyrobaculum sp. TaxID=2004705 RepID=UPI0031671743
ALEELTRRCRTRCCTVPHRKILEHPEVAALIHSLGYKVRATPAAAMSIDILAQTGFQLYKNPSGRVVVRICRGAEQRDELFEAMCKLANGIGGAVTLAASKIADAAGLEGHAYVMRAAAMLAELCQTLPCTKLKNGRYVFDRKALLEYCKKQTYTERRLKRYKPKYGRDKSTTVVTFKVPAEMLEGLQRLAEQWGTTRSAVIRTAVEKLLEKLRNSRQLLDNALNRPAPAGN